MSKYEIKSGDTLGAIAQTYGTTVVELARRNKISNPDRINAGRVIQVPDQEKTLMQQAQSFIGAKEKPEVQPPPIAQAPEKKPAPISKRKITVEKEAAPVAKPQPSLMAPPEKDEPLLPTNIRQFVYDIFGGEKPLTEKNLQQEELKSLTESVARAKASGKDILEYEDYATESKGQSQYSDIGGGGGFADFFEKVFDPTYSMKTTIGQASIEEDEEGNTIVVDRYNFNNSDDKFSFMGLMSGIKRAGFSPYAQLRNIGTQLGSSEGSGSEVRINLGKIASTDIKKVEGLI